MVESILYEETQPPLIPKRSQKQEFVKLAKIYMRAVTTVDNELVGLSEGMTDPSIAIGVQLSNLAKIVGAPLIADEDLQETLIVSQIAVNKSTGGPEEIIQILRILVEDQTLLFGTAILYREFFPAYFQAGFPHETTAEVAAAMSAQINKAKPAGVGYSFFFSTLPKANTFNFSSDDTLQSNANTGFGDVLQTVGGGLAGVFSS